MVFTKRQNDIIIFFNKPQKIVVVILIYCFSAYPLYAQYDFIQEVYEQTEKGQSRKAIERIDSALKDGIRSRDDSTRTNLLYIKAYAFDNLAVNDETAIDSAISNYKLVVSAGISPINIGALNSLGRLYGDLGNYVQSIAYFKQILTIDSNNVVALNNIAYDKNQSEAYEESILYSDKTYKLAKEKEMKGVALNNKAYSYLKLGKLNEALKLIEASLKLGPQNSFAYYHKALVYIERKEFDKACVNLNKSKELGGINLTSDLIEKYCKKRRK